MSRSSTAPRRDIQGLRAFAVLVVFLDHLLGWPAGGFAGVDIFFVISGFLITGLLLRQYERSATISFRGFYANRAKRILPAATLTIVVTLLVSQWILADRRAASITVDGLWAMFFGANWRFAASGTDYFEQGGAVSPLQHYWSLSVEEQFYFVWPWVLLGLLLVLAKDRAGRRPRTRVVAGASIGVVIVASLAWAAASSSAEPTVAYFSTFTRAWELGLGALLAVVAPLLQRMAVGVRVALLYSGLTAMVVSLFVISPETAWPYPWALLPVVGAVAFIASGVGSEARYNPVFTNRGAVFIGDISYSLYLWHFPVIILGPALFPGEGPVVHAIVFAAGLALAVATYYAVERPLHKMPLWSDDSSVTAWRTWRVNYAHSAKAAGVAVLAMLTAVVTGLAFGPMSGQVAAPPGPPRSIQLDTDAAEPDSVGHRELTACISESIEATEWPEDIESEMDLAGGLPDDVKQCAAPSPYVEEGCAWGDGERVAYVVGDSVANAYVPMYRTVLGPEWQVRQLTLNGCEFSSANLSSAGSAAVCERRVSSAISTIAASDPDVVFVTSQWTGHTKAGGKEKVGVDEWWTGARDALEQITAPTIYVAPPPGGVSVDACYSSTTAPATCASTISETWAASHAHLTRYAKSSDQLDLVDTSTWFCVEGVCPAFVGSTLTRSDHVHPTQAYLDDVAVVAKEDIRALLPEG